MSSEQTFKSFLDSFADLSKPQNLKSYVNEFSNNAFEYARVTVDFKTIEYQERNMKTGKYETGTIDIDKHLYAKAVKYFDNPTKFSAEFTTTAEIEMCLKTLRITLKEVEENEFYEKFPAYRAAIIKLGNKLNEFKGFDESYNSLIESTKVPGEKKVKVYELECIVEIIKNSPNHDSAVQKIKEKLKKKYPKHDWRNFQWTKRQGKLIHVRSGKINGVGASKLLEKIAEKIFDDDQVPSDETFREYLLK